MMPTLKTGNWFAVERYPGGRLPEAGDLVVFRSPHDLAVIYVKRLVGLPDDRVQMIGGALHLNGQPVKRERIEDYLDDRGGMTSRVKRWRETLPNGRSYETLDLVDNGFRDNTQVYVVPAGHCFVLGDNRDNSSDSRVLNQVGYVPLENVIGKMFRPWRRFFSATSARRGQIPESTHPNFKLRPAA